MDIDGYKNTTYLPMCQNSKITEAVSRVPPGLLACWLNSPIFFCILTCFVVRENSCRVRENSRKSQGILKSNVCGNPVSIISWPNNHHFPNLLFGFLPLFVFVF